MTEPPTNGTIAVHCFPRGLGRATVVDVDRDLHGMLPNEFEHDGRLWEMIAGCSLETPYYEDAGPAKAAP